MKSLKVERVKRNTFQHKHNYIYAEK